MPAAPDYTRQTAAAARKRGPRPRPPKRAGRPLEEFERPVINGLFAHGRGDDRQRTPPEKENRRGDDVFMAQAELRALGALNTKLQTELCAFEERYQDMEFEKSEAIAAQHATEKKVRRLELEARDSQRDFQKAETDAERYEAEARDSLEKERVHREDADALRHQVAGLEDQCARDAEVLSMKQASLDAAERAAAESQARADTAECQLVDFHEAFEGEKARLEEENTQLQEDVDQLQEDVRTEREWREAAQLELAQLKEAEPADEEADFAPDFVPPSVVRNAEPPKRVVGCFGYKRTAVKKPGKQQDGAVSTDHAPSIVTAADWKKRWREEKKRADVLHAQLRGERERAADAEKKKGELEASLERAKSSVRFERHRAERAKGGHAVPKRRPGAKVVSVASPEPPQAPPSSKKKKPASLKAKPVAAVRPATPGSWDESDDDDDDDVPVFLRDDSDDDSDDGVPLFLREDDDEISRAVRKNYDFVPGVGTRKVPPKGRFMPLGGD